MQYSTAHALCKVCTLQRRQHTHTSGAGGMQQSCLTHIHLQLCFTPYIYQACKLARTATCQRHLPLRVSIAGIIATLSLRLSRHRKTMRISATTKPYSGVTKPGWSLSLEPLLDPTTCSCPLRSVHTVLQADRFPHSVYVHVQYKPGVGSIGAETIDMPDFRCGSLIGYSTSLNW